MERTLFSLNQYVVFYLVQAFLFFAKLFFVSCWTNIFSFITNIPIGRDCTRLTSVILRTDIF